MKKLPAISPFVNLFLMLLTICIPILSGCNNPLDSNSGDWDDSELSPKAVTEKNITITTDTVWRNTTVTITGTLTIAPHATLTLDTSTLNFKPALEDTNTFVINDGNFIANNSRIRSRSGNQWNLEAFGSSQLTFKNTTATNHTGIRAYGSTVLTTEGGKIEEIQCHDDATLNIRDGAGVYVVLFFNNTGAVNLPDGMLASGDGITRSFTYKSSPATTGKININKANIWGFQLDIEGNTDLSIAGGTGIVLALHLEDVGKITITDDITSVTAGCLDFSPLGGPKFTFTDSEIDFINTYVCGESDVTVSGRVKVVEPNVWDAAKLTFGPNTSLIADLAQAYDDAVLTFDRVTLITDDSIPSFTAQGNATIYIKNVTALEGTKVCAAEEGKVYINGGSGWNDSMFETLDDGDIIYTP